MVTLKVVLERAGVKAGVKDLVLYGADGYNDSIPLKRAMKGYNLLAYKMNNDLLPRKHVFSFRLIVAGIYRMKNVKWLERIINWWMVIIRVTGRERGGQMRPL